MCVQSKSPGQLLCRRLCIVLRPSCFDIPPSRQSVRPRQHVGSDLGSVGTSLLSDQLLSGSNAARRSRSVPLLVFAPPKSRLRLGPSAALLGARHVSVGYRRRRQGELPAPRCSQHAAPQACSGRLAGAQTPPSAVRRRRTVSN